MTPPASRTPSVPASTPPTSASASATASTSASASATASLTPTASTTATAPSSLPVTGAGWKLLFVVGGILVVLGLLAVAGFRRGRKITFRA